jgi:hypothetical protein
MSDEPAARRRSLKFRIFNSSTSSWDTLCQSAADLADRVGPENLVSVSHSQEGMHGVIIVWYWTS